MKNVPQFARLGQRGRGVVRAPDSPFAKHAPGFRIRHLYHDREEFTVVGEVTGR